jgi:dipeptidyl aminopeptidase/acylaminoacyl peptidase
MRIPLLAVAACWALTLRAQVPENLVVEGVPAIPEELKVDASRYLEFRNAAFQDWHPTRRELLITTRFADSSQLHLVGMPGGARRQLTFLSEPVSGGSFRPKTGEMVVFSQDKGGGEFYQLYGYDPDDGRITLLTDGRSRNTGTRWAGSGKRLAYTSTRRNGKDNDIYLMDPAIPRSDRLAVEVAGGGWSVQDWSPDETRLLLLEYLSINESYLHLVDLKAGARTLLTPKGSQPVAYSQAQFARDGKSLFVTSDKDSEFRRLARMDLAKGGLTPLTAHIRWDVDDFDLSPDGRTVAFITNEDGASALRLLDTRTGRELTPPKLPLGVIGALKWHQNGRDIGFTLTSARSPSDIYSVDVRTRKLERWTESETGGLNPAGFVEPERVRLKSSGDLPISAFVYRPDPKKFPGRRPVLIHIHGGPESQARPVFQWRSCFRTCAAPPGMGRHS